MFAKITARNFFSWESLEFDFQSGVTLIAGQNLDDNTSEGSGKSSIPNALCWALYGQLPKDVNIDDVIKTGAKSCTVEIELLDGTKIVRSRKPNQLYIEFNGSVETGKDLKETQKLVDAEIGMGFDTFCQSVYFAQNYSNKFITANQEQKAKILSELQDLSIFDKASKKAHEMLKKSVSELSLLDVKLAEKNSTYSHHNANIKALEKLSNSFDSDQSKKLQDLVLKQAEINEKAVVLKAEVDSLGSIEDTVDLELNIQKTIDERNKVERELYYIEQLKAQRDQAKENETCPACGKPLDKNDVCFNIPDNAKLLERKEALDLDVHNLASRGLEIKNKKRKNDELLYQLGQLMGEEYKIDTQVKSLESSSNPYSQLVLQSQNQIEPLKKTIEDIKLEIDKIKKYVTYLEFLKSGYKEIKSYVFQGLLSDLNNKTNKYLRELFDVSAYITFDNVSDEGDISKIQTKVILDGYERSLGLLSGGQFRRVQLAVDFALSEIVSERSQKPINIRILDEAFKDLSESSMEKIIIILQKMSGCSILIEHNSLIKSVVNRVFNVELKDGTSNVVHIAI